MAQIIENANFYDDSLYDMLNDADEAISSFAPKTTTQMQNKSYETKETFQKDINNQTQKIFHDSTTPIIKKSNEIHQTSVKNSEISVENSLADEVISSMQFEAVMEDAKNHMKQNASIYEETPSETEKDVRNQKIKERKILETLHNLKIYPYLCDAKISKIIIQKHHQIYIEKNHEKESVPVLFENEVELQNELELLYHANKEIYTELPFFREFVIPGDIRVAYSTPPLSQGGIVAVITLPDVNLIKPKDFVTQHAVSKEMLYFLERCMRGHLNILITGEEKLARTEFFNLLNSFIPEQESVITIDPMHTLKFPHNNVCCLNPNVIKDESISVFQIAEQMNSDRIVLVTLNADTVSDFLETAYTNYKSCITSIYAHTPRNACIKRIPLLYQAKHPNVKELDFLQKEILSSFHLIVHVGVGQDGKNRITNISHLSGLNEDGLVNLKEIFIYDKQTEEFQYTGYNPKTLVRLIRQQNIIFDNTIFQKNE